MVLHNPLQTVYNQYMARLLIVATPIGNLEDITYRAVRTLLSVDYIACEDPRRTGQFLKILTQKYGQADTALPKLIPFYDEIEETASFEIINILTKGKDIALISDSGTPLISDPGYKLVNLAIKSGIVIDSLPGPSAVTTALTLSGLPPTPFMFLGFPPPSENKKRNWFNLLKENKLRISVIFYESPHRLIDTLKIMQEVFSDSGIVICRELTKIHQEVWRGRLPEAIKYFTDPKGEFVVLLRL